MNCAVRNNLVIYIEYVDWVLQIEGYRDCVVDCEEERSANNRANI